MLPSSARHDYDGFDVDWEYPESTQDRDFLVEFMAGLRETNPNYVLSLDAAPWGGSGYDVAQLKESIDYFNIMMYDCAGPWTDDGQLNSPIFWDWHDPEPWECQPGGSAADAAKIFLKDSPPPTEYGNALLRLFLHQHHQIFGVCPNSVFTPDGNCDNAVLTENYAPFIKIASTRMAGKRFMTHRASSYMLRNDGTKGYITYDDRVSTYLRVSYSDWPLGLGGTFMWSLDADYDGHSQDLLDAMYQATISQGQ